MMRLSSFKELYVSSAAKTIFMLSHNYRQASKVSDPTIESDAELECLECGVWEDNMLVAAYSMVAC